MSSSTDTSSRVSRYGFIAVLVVVACLLAALWTATPLREYMSVEALTEVATDLETTRFAFLIVLAVYVFGVLCAVPVMLLIAVTGLVFGAWPGVGYAFAGTMLSAATSFAIGRWLGENRLRKFAGARVESISKRLGREGIKAVLAVRLVPVAPFVLINIIVGASHVRFRDFMIGTALGMSPGILLKIVFFDQLADAARTSNENALLTAAGIAVALVVLGLLARRFYTGKRRGD